MRKQIILLNGPSSSGKSTLARALQARIEEARLQRWAVVSIDECMKLSTDEVIYEDDVFGISGDLCQKASEALMTAPGVIVDHVITSERIFAGLKALLGAHSLFMVRVTCPLDELKRRERACGDRHPGSAEASYRYLFPVDGYHLTVDTCRMTTDECARAICRALYGA